MNGFISELFLYICLEQIWENGQEYDALDRAGMFFKYSFSQCNCNLIFRCGILFLGVEFKMVQDNAREEVDLCPPEGRSKTKIPKCLRKPKTYHVDELYLFVRDLLTCVEGK